MRSTLLAVVFLALVATGSAARADEPISSLSGEGRELLRGAATLWVVTTPGWEATGGELVAWRRGEGGWVSEPPVPITVGHAGLRWGTGLTVPPGGGRLKREGDGATPAGLFRVAGVVGEGEAGPGSAAALPYRRATAATRCVDDPTSPAYNRIVEAPSDGAEPWRTAEHMVRGDGLYRLLAVVDHNGGGGGLAVPGGGSCIFVHAWSAPTIPTVGCVALAPGPLGRLLAAPAPVLIAIVPAPLLPAARIAWGLPGPATARPEAPAR